MGEYIGASIQLGGKLPNEHVDELIELIQHYGLTANFNGDDPNRDNLGSLFGDWEVNYGNLDDIESFAQQHGLHYKSWFDSGGEWSAATTRHNPDTGETIQLLDSNGGGPTLTLSEIETLGTYDAVVAHIRKVTAPLPPLEIV